MRNELGDNAEGTPEEEDTPDEEVVRAANEVVNNSLEVVRTEVWQERMLRQFDSASGRSGLRAITGPRFAFYDPITALINFEALSLNRFRDVVDFLDEDAKAKRRSTPRVPAPLPVIGTVNIFINQLRLDLGRQLPEEGRDQGGRP